MNEKLSEGLKKLSLDFSTEQIGQLETYCSCVLEFNKTYNLMKAENEDELYVNHVLDSLAACSALEKFICLLYTSPSPRDRTRSRMPSSA